MIRISSRFYRGSTRNTSSVRKGASVATTSYAGSPFAYGGTMYQFSYLPLLGTGRIWRVGNRYETEKGYRTDQRELDRSYDPYENPQPPDLGPPPEYPFQDFNYGDVYG